MTSGTFGRKKFVVVVLAIGTTVLFVKVVRTERDRAFVAIEALRMPLLAHGIDRVTL